ncbi:MAG: hypothetical protein AB8G95_14405 [Anaerolineae bacterium]
MPKHEQVTWNSVGGNTLAVLTLSCAFGIWLSLINIQLESSWPPANMLFYYLVGGLPSVFAFCISTFKLRPKGKGIMLVALPIFSSIIFFLYVSVAVTSIPYLDIECRSAEPQYPNGLLDCQCHKTYTVYNTDYYEDCQAKRLFPRPFLMVVDES